MSRLAFALNLYAPVCHFNFLKDILSPQGQPGEAGPRGGVGEEGPQVNRT